MNDSSYPTQSNPNVEEQLRRLTDYARLLQQNGQLDASLPLLMEGVQLLLASNELAYRDDLGYRALCGEFSVLLANCGVYDRELILRTRQEVMRDSYRYGDPPDLEEVYYALVGNSGWQAVFTRVEEHLGAAGAMLAGIELNELVLAGSPGELRTNINTLMLSSLATGLARGGHYDKATSVLAKLDGEDESVCKAWMELLRALVDALEETKFKALWEQLKFSQAGTKFAKVGGSLYPRGPSGVSLDMRSMIDYLGVDIFTESWAPLIARVELEKSWQAR